MFNLVWYVLNVFWLIVEMSAKDVNSCVDRCVWQVISDLLQQTF